MATFLPVISALGTVWRVEIFEQINNEKTQTIFDGLSFFITEFENKYSRFKANSVISSLNKNGFLENPDQETIDLLEYGKKMYLETNGIFNLLIGEILIHRGYDENYSLKPKQALAPEIPNPENVLVLSKQRITLAAGMIDLGGFGKGYLIDLLATELRDTYNLQYFLINGGGDMYATSDYGTPITIYLEHPTKPDTYLAETTLKDQGFAASSTHKRRWQVAGKEYSHIVNTKHNFEEVINTNRPDDLGVYIKAPSAVQADVWATTLLINSATKPNPTLAIAVFDISKETLSTSKNFSTTSYR